MKSPQEEKNSASTDGHIDRVKEQQKEVNQQIKAYKNDYKNSLEQTFQQDNPSTAWKAKQAITGIKPRKQLTECNSDFTNDLNNFYGRFDVCENNLLNMTLRMRSELDIVDIGEADHGP